MPNSIHFGHAGRDAKLLVAADAWRKRINREVAEKAIKCPDCSKSSKNIKCFKYQNEYGQFLIIGNPNDAVSIQFTESFPNAKTNKKQLHWQTIIQDDRKRCFWPITPQIV